MIKKTGSPEPIVRIVFELPKLCRYPRVSKKHINDKGETRR